MVGDERKSFLCLVCQECAIYVYYCGHFGNILTCWRIIHVCYLNLVFMDNLQEGRRVELLLGLVKLSP